MRLFEFEAPIKEEELDEAAPENARSLAIYNELADQFADNPKALKQEFIKRLTAEFPNLQPARANAWLGFAHKAAKAHAERAASHDAASGPMQALRTKDILNRQNNGQRRAAAPGMVPGPDNDLDAADYDIKRMLSDIDRVKAKGADGIIDWDATQEAGGEAIEVTWDIEYSGRDGAVWAADYYQEEINTANNLLKGLCTRYKDKVISYRPFTPEQAAQKDAHGKTKENGYIGGSAKFKV